MRRRGGGTAWRTQRNARVGVSKLGQLGARRCSVALGECAGVSVWVDVGVHVRRIQRNQTQHLSIFIEFLSMWQILQLHSKWLFCLKLFPRKGPNRVFSAGHTGNVSSTRHFASDSWQGHRQPDPQRDGPSSIFRQRQTSSGKKQKRNKKKNVKISADARSERPRLRRAARHVYC